MPITQGNFTASQLAQTIVKADRMFSDDMRKADYTANVDVYKAVKAEQTADVRILKSSEKDRDVKVFWINNCTNQATDCDADDCDLGGEEAGTDSKTYGIGECIKYDFTVNEYMFRSQEITMEEVVAKQMLLADKALAEKCAQFIAARIESYKGTNTVTNGLGVNNATSGDVDIPAAAWNERVFAYLYRAAIQNQFSNPFLLSGTNMFEDKFITEKSKGNAEGKGAAALYASMRQYYDLFNMDLVTNPDLKTYMINRGSIAFASKNYYPARPINYKEQDRYSIASKNLAGVRYDVIYTNKCSGNEYKHHWRLKLHFDTFLNPTGCDAGRTGIIAFNKSA